MKESLEGPADWQRSVIAVPPLARTEALAIDEAANRALIRHLEAGGISIIMCGGNANFYNVALSEYEAILDFLAATVAPGTWVIPSIGPAYGAMLDQAAILARKRFPTAMVLPTMANMTQAGVERAVRLTVERLGMPLVIYLKDENYLDVERVAALDRDGCLRFVKYAIVRPDPRQDDFLRRLIAAIGTEKIVSGIGERPALAHFRDFGLAGFTTGSGAVAPGHSMRLLAALKAADHARAEAIRQDFLPLETLRDRHGPAFVLHEAVTLAGIADMGPMLPLMSNIAPELRDPVGRAARALLAIETGTAAGPRQAAMPG
jgi:dihydrodipicolinate synthase/N-acetylneuraminate lyase